MASPLGVLLLVGLSLAGGWVAGRYAARRREQRLVQEQAVELREQLRAAQAGLAQVQAALDATRAVVTEGIIDLDAEQRIRHANATACAWFDLNPGQRPSLVSALRSADVRDILQAALRGETATESVHLNDCLYQVHVVPLADGGAVLALMDVTALERAMRSRRDLVANVSHDLRTPLASITLLVESLLSSPHSKKRTRDLAEQIRAQVATLQALADGLVELSMIESGRALFRLQAEPLLAMAEAAVDSLAPQLAEKDVTVAIDIHSDVQVLADRPHIVRVFTNLLDNAQRFSSPTGQVEIRTAPTDEPDRIAISITDDGPGIAPAELGRIFERFYRGDRARTRGGSGLGLAIARHIIEGHGGTIVALNNAHGGATFRFTLPLAG